MFLIYKRAQKATEIIKGHGFIEKETKIIILNVDVVK